MITVSTKEDKQGSAMRLCAHDIEEDGPPAEPREVLALSTLMALGIFALMTLANDGLSTSSLLRDLLRLDMVGGKGMAMAWCTSNPGHSL